MFKDARNNDRIIFDDTALAARLFDRAKPFLPSERYEWSLCGFNERLRFYRYEKGQYFKMHKDGTYARSETEESMLTFMIYLNQGFEGGETKFQWDTVKPETGMALVFPHRMFHKGDEVKSGVKYVLRTDVMYKKQ